MEILSTFSTHLPVDPINALYRMREASIPGKSVTQREIPADSSGGRERFPGDSGISTKYEYMEEYRRQTERGEILYRLKDTPSGKKKLEITYPGVEILLHAKMTIFLYSATFLPKQALSL